MPTTTTNYGWTKPNVNDPTDQDLWGGYLNANLDAQDTTVKSISDKANLTSTAISTKTANYTVLASDQCKVIAVDATSGNITITLLPAATATSGFKIGIKKTDSSSNTVTIDGNASETIDGALTFVLSNQYENVYIISNGTNWYVEDTLTQSIVGTGVKAYQSTGTSLTAGSFVVVGFDAEDYDDGTYHDNVTNNSRLTVNFTGRISITGQVTIPNINNGIYALKIRKNGSTDIALNQSSFGAGTNTTLQVSGDFSVTSGDYFELLVYNGPAPTVTSSTGIGVTFFSFFRLK